MKVSQMTGNNGNPVRNQFIISSPDYRAFQSYDSVIVKITHDDDGNRVVTLDKNTWDYSKTTAKYRNLFLGETTKEIEKKIKDGVYLLDNLNND